MKELGNGKYGRVYLVRERSSNFVCALKVIEKKLLHEEEITDQFIREVKIQMFLNHPNIIKMYGCFDDAVNIYIILEVGTGGQLYHQLKKSQPLSEPRIAFIMKQVCEAVNEIHSLKIIHRDIKPENIVLHDVPPAPPRTSSSCATSAGRCTRTTS
jgi:serine/threonine protein kinase